MDRSTYLEPLSRAFLKFYRVTKKLQSPGNSSPKNMTSKDSMEGFGIIISTFEDRFFTYALPLIQSLRVATSSPITLIINGNLSKKVNPSSFSKFLREVSQFSDVYPVSFQNFQGCAKMWNTGILFSGAEQFLILNDDISIVPDDFMTEVNSALKTLQQHKVSTINLSWSHFLISKQAIKEIGWFDERLLGIGNEDGDYDNRHHALFGRKVENLSLASFINISDDSRDYSVVPTKSKYSLFNEIMHEEKSTSGHIGLHPPLYPLWGWSQDMQKYLTINDPVVVREVIRKRISGS